MPAAEPPWSVLVRVLSAVASGAAPGPADHDAVATLVSRGLLERTDGGVRLSALGVIVLDEE